MCVCVCVTNLRRYSRLCIFNLHIYSAQKKPYVNKEFLHRVTSLVLLVYLIFKLNNDINEIDHLRMITSVTREKGYFSCVSFVYFYALNPKISPEFLHQICLTAGGNLNAGHSMKFVFLFNFKFYIKIGRPVN